MIFSTHSYQCHISVDTSCLISVCNFKQFRQEFDSNPCTLKNELWDKVRVRLRLGTEFGLGLGRELGFGLGTGQTLFKL